jgi:hypothetical protein
MSDLISRGEFEMLLQTMRDGFDGTHRRLDIANGQLREHASDIATLKERTAGNKGTAAVTGGGASVAVMGLTKLIEWLTK